MTTSNAFYASLLTDCRSLLGRFQHCKVQHVLHEVNRVADALAKLGCYMQIPICALFVSVMTFSKKRVIFQEVFSIKLSYFPMFGSNFK